MITGSPIPISAVSDAFAHPYIVRTPPYARASAGIRVLHWLCDALNRLGAEAYVDVDTTRGPPGADPAGGVAAGLAAPPLTEARRDALTRPGRTPIFIHPDAFDDAPGEGVHVRYLLNYLGVMGDAKPAPCDLTVGYSEAIRRATPGCDDVLFIPGSDPRWWTPPAHSTAPAHPRRTALVYAGKYVDHHRQTLPLYLHDFMVIPRHGPDAPTTEALRDLLRSATHLYVFENTAVAAEAALCGCPVVVCRNWFFRELIAEHELGLNGFTENDSPESLAGATAQLGAFREHYETAIHTVEAALSSFVAKTQELAGRVPAMFVSRPRRSVHGASSAARENSKFG